MVRHRANHRSHGVRHAGGMRTQAAATRRDRSQPVFHGRHVVRAAFVLAMCGWGIGFYGPPIYLHAVIARTGWPLEWVSAAVTVHFVFGALVVARLPRWHARFGVGPCAVAGAVASTLGVLGWAWCGQPWQLFVAALASGGGWVAMGAVAVNAAIAPWFVRTRPAALATAYNGASVGGVLFSPLWVALIGAWGFGPAALAIGLTTVVVMAGLARWVFARTPQSLGQRPDDDTAPASTAAPAVPALPGRLLWRDRRFRTLALGMAIGLFAQIGVLAHLFALLVPLFGAQRAGWAMGLATACAMAGRVVVAQVMPAAAPRRVVAALGYAVQLLGMLVLCGVGENQVVPIVLAIVLFGSGIGNATSLPPLIAQQEFAPPDVPRVVALVVATAQGTYAFAPVLFGALLQASGAVRVGAGSTAFFATVALLQALALACILAGHRG